MNFGKVPTTLFDQLHLALPPDHPETIAVLTGQRVHEPRVFVGCSSWGITEWKGTLYPRTTAPASMLALYAKQFNTVELSPLYYGLPAPDQLRKWKNSVPPGFLFCPKFSSSITHDKKLRNCTKELAEYLTAVTELDDCLGPVFFMPHPAIGPAQLNTLLDFIDSLPPDFKYFIELRNAQWFSTDHALFDELKKRSKSALLTDVAGRRDVLHMHLTQPETFIRFVGNDLHPTDFTRIDDWVNRLTNWLEQGLHTCYFFVHQHNERFAPELAHYFISELNRKAGLQIPLPQIQQEKGLFDSL